MTEIFNARESKLAALKSHLHKKLVIFNIYTENWINNCAGWRERY